MDELQQDVDFGALAALQDSDMAQITDEKKLDRFLGLPMRFYSKREEIEIDLSTYAAERVKTVNITQEQRKMDKSTELSAKQQTEYRSAIG